MNNQNHTGPLNCNRRDFLKYAGIGAAAFTLGNIPLISNAATTMTQINSNVYDTDVLIVGGGIAATFAAIKARQQGVRVTLVDKGYVGRSGLTPWFHGFAHYDPKDPNKTSPAAWLHGFMQATEFMSRKDYIDLFLEDSKDRWEELCSWVPAKSLPTGKGPYLREQIEKSGTQIIEGVMIAELLKKDDRIVGAIGIPRDEDNAIVFKAGAVVLCTGAGTFKSPGWPMSPNTFDGHIMAYKMGAQIAGKEWNDFHWTNPENPGDCWANYGDHLRMPLESPTDPGAHSLRNIFWSAYDGVPAADAPPSSGKLPGPPPQGSPGEKPSGPPPDKGNRVLGAALGCAEHRMDGIFPKDNRCWSGVEGLYAAGDAMCTGGVGTKGSSSPGCAVQGARAGIYAAEHARQTKQIFLSKTEINTVKSRIFQSRVREKGYSPQWVTRTIQNTMMPYYVLYVKKQDRLEAALTNIKFLKDHFLPRLVAGDPHELRLALETENMIINAEMKLRASMFRKESRHSHFREDFPYRDDKNWLAFVVLRKKGDRMNINKWDIPREWLPTSLLKLSYKDRYTDRFPGEEAYLNTHKL